MTGMRLRSFTLRASGNDWNVKRALDYTAGVIGLHEPDCPWCWEGLSNGDVRVTLVRPTFGPHVVVPTHALGGRA